MRYRDEIGALLELARPRRRPRGRHGLGDFALSDLGDILTPVADLVGQGFQIFNTVNNDASQAQQLEQQAQSLTQQLAAARAAAAAKAAAPPPPAASGISLGTVAVGLGAIGLGVLIVQGLRK